MTSEKIQSNYGKDKKVKIHDEEIQPIPTIKYLGLHVNEQLTWAEQVNYMTSNARRRLYSLKHLSSVFTDTDLIKTCYNSLIRPTMEYASTVWHFGLTSKQQKQIEKQQHIACKMTRLKEAPCLTDRTEKQCLSKYHKLELDNDNILNQFISDKLKITGHYRVPYAKTERLKNTFFMETPVLFNMCK